jgi:hypothetical protein
MNKCHQWIIQEMIFGSAIGHVLTYNRGKTCSNCLLGNVAKVHIPARQLVVHYIEHNQYFHPKCAQQSRYFKDYNLQALTKERIKIFFSEL